MHRKWFLIMTLVITTLVLLVGVVPAAAVPSEDGPVHVVRRGETLYSIARRYGVDVWAVARANGIANPNRIYVGQRLVIPAGRPAGIVHVVRPGEMLTRIALRYGVDAWTIARANGITNLNRIYVGQRLVIPGAAPPVSPPREPSQPSLPVSWPGPWSGEYFDNVTLAGPAYTTRYDESINFNWGWGPPVGGMPVNSFSVRWTGTFNFAGGTYRFYARVDDGVRVYVDGEQIINGWRDGGLRLYTADRTLAAGDHTVQVEYYDRVQVARIYFWWKQLAGPAPTPTVPPTTTPPPGKGWFGEYFNNTTLAGPACVTRYDAKVDFDWGYGSPTAGVPGDHFSARWAGTFYLAEGTYRFSVKVDDGVRVYVDGQRIIDGWRDGGLRLYTADRTLSAGNHTIQVEYYERTHVARVHFWWEFLSGPKPTTTPAPSEGWLGQFYNNEDLEGSPVATSHDPWIGFDWGTGSPPGVNSEHFSARWTTTLYLKTDHYRFCAMSDDGARIWVGGKLVLDEWHANNGIAYCGDYWAETGIYEVKVEYYEDGGNALIYVWWEPH